MDNSEHIKDCPCAWCEVDRQNAETRSKAADGGLYLTPCCVSSRPFDVGLNLIDAVGRATRILCRSCQWSEDEDGNWDSACGESHTFTTDGPKENKARWCCYCGGELVAVPFPHNDQVEAPNA